MSLCSIVLDFDGTFTDVEREAPGFVRAFPGILSAKIGRSIAHLWAEAESAARAEAPELGWTFDGKVAAPADADPYILCACTAQKILGTLGLFADDRERSTLLNHTYAAAYEFTETAFRPEAAEVLRGLCELGVPVTVVTNSTTSVVRKKLVQLVPELMAGERPAIGLFGEARKFLTVPASGETDPRFAGLAEGTSAPGLRRPVLLRRGIYFDVLRQIWAQSGGGPSETLVAGDIFELDLALPAALGAHVHLVRRKGVHAYEEAAVQAVAGGRGQVSDGVGPVLARARELKGN